jgi:hypothetical protein
LDLLYRHPTQPLIGNAASDAIVAARAAEREDLLVAAFRHLSTIPLEFEAKAEVQRALAVIQEPEEGAGGRRHSGDLSHAD